MIRPLGSLNFLERNAIMRNKHIAREYIASLENSHMEAFGFRCLHPVARVR